MSTARGLRASTIARTAAPAGVITMRTNSILTVLAWHAGIAVPLLAVMVCR